MATYEIDFEVMCECGQALPIVRRLPGDMKPIRLHGEALKFVVQSCECCKSKAQELGRSKLYDDLSKLKQGLGDDWPELTEEQKRRLDAGCWPRGETPKKGTEP